MNAERTLRVLGYLEHMREAALRIERYVAGVSQADFAASTLIQDTVIRNFEVIGEAARNVETTDPAFAQRNPGIDCNARDASPPCAWLLQG